MKRKYLEWKLKLVEKEIKEWEATKNTALVYLRQHKKKQWALIEKMERLDEE